MTLSRRGLQDMYNKAQPWPPAGGAQLGRSLADDKQLVPCNASVTHMHTRCMASQRAYKNSTAWQGECTRVQELM